MHLTTDRDLTAGDLQELISADAVVAFFSGLGYDTSARMTQTAAAMGISAESLQRKIRRIERVASQDGGTLEVYLVELDSVTVAAIRGLARALRDRAGDFLLVLTDDYDTIDFVLLERERSTRLPAGPATPRVTVRPRTLSVPRRDPGRVAMRVLRRFTYTEGDAFAQYDKLRSAYGVAEWSEPLFNNRALFSDYFLNVRLPELPEWLEDPKPAFRRLVDLYDGARDRFAGADEATVRRELIEPALEVLGFALSASRSADRAPDYRLAADDEGKAIVAGLAYTWDRALDGRDETRDSARSGDNPGARVVSVLEASGAPWAIVTNGKLWRLYAAAAASRATSYYELDLEETLAAVDPNEAFRYFWLFFRAAAFQPHEVLVSGERREISFLDRLLRESADYARRLGDRLKERVFEEVFPALAEGFIASMRHFDGDTLDLSSERLDEVFRGTLTLLYRLLFLLYAESRDLLPVRETRGFWERSLSRLKREVADEAGPIRDEVEPHIKNAYSAAPTATALYDRLVALARTVDQGDATVNTPLYNGGLFLSEIEADDESPEAVAARFLLRFKVPDRFLALALDRLARDVDEKRGDLAPIDYKSLGVRQLGSIYEGLLEFRLRIAPEKMAIVRGKKTEEIVPYREAVAQKRAILTEGRGRNAPQRTKPKGAVYLENDRRERKATGSYYTPDYIVKYIVAHAVGPALQEHLERFRPELRLAQKAYRDAKQRQAGFQKSGMKGDDPEKIANEQRWRDLVDDLFAFRVLDPAMGSGHFLVEAVDFITDRLLDFLNGFPWNLVQARLRQTRETILAELERQRVVVDHARLTDVNLLKRHVLKRCVYGVDLNPMAVELAKVSLWLHCFTLGAPLSFLDHHLKCGNSLIGTTVQDVEAELAAGKQGHVGDIFGSPFAGLLSATALIEELSQMPDATVEQSRRSHSLFTAFEKAQEPYKAALDIWVSRFFGNRRAQEYLTLVGGDYVEQIRTSGQKLSPEYQQVIATAAALCQTRRFFHWDLEFPEVFVDLKRKGWKPKDQRGFDAVVGNPPWVRQEALGEMKTALQTYHDAVYDSIADTYVYFVGRGLGVLRRGAGLGMILPNKWLRAAYGRPLRAFVSARHRPLELIDFGHAPIFPDADTFPCVLIAAAGRSTTVSPLRYCPIPRELLNGLAIEDFVERHVYEVPTVLLRDEGWAPEPPEAARLLEKIRTGRRTIADIAPSGLYRGIIPGLTEAFFVDQRTRNRLVAEDPRCEPLLRKVLRGRNVERWHPDWDNEWLILLKSSENHAWPWASAGGDAERVFSETYPSLYRHLKPFQRVLEKRQDRGRYWWELRSCSYYAEFEQPKVLYQDISYHSWFSLDRDGLFCNNTCYFMPVDGSWPLGILNSSVIWWYLARQATHAKDEAFRLHTQFVEQLPIAEPDSAHRQEIESILDRLIALAAEQQRIRRNFLQGLASKLGIDKPARKLQQFWRLSAEGLTKELARLTPRQPGSGKPSALDAGATELASEYRKLAAETICLELRAQQIVFEAYSLTPDEIAYLRATAPPRDPLALIGDEARSLGLDPAL